MEVNCVYLTPGSLGVDVVGQNADCLYQLKCHCAVALAGQKGLDVACNFLFKKNCVSCT